MDRIVETPEPVLLDLGAASIETRGGFIGPGEFDGKLIVGGIAED